MNAFPHFYYAPLAYFLSLIIYKLAREAEQLNNRHEPPGLPWLWCCHDNSAAVNPGCVQVPSETYWRSQMCTCCTVEDKLLLRVEWRTVSFKMEPFGLIWPYMEQQSFLVYFWWEVFTLNTEDFNHISFGADVFTHANHSVFWDFGKTQSDIVR